MTHRLEDFRVFLSHKYEAAQVNSFVYDLLSGSASLSFDVDSGKHPETGENLSTNVTLLERAIRRANAFVGIFAFEEGKPGPGPTGADQARRDSGYSLLELDIAERMRKPGLVFCDSRIKNYFRFPKHFTVESLDVGATEGGLGRVQARDLGRSVTAFLGDLAAAVSIRSADRFEKGSVGIIVPRKKRDGSPLTKAQLNCVVELIRNGWSAELIEWDSIDYRLLKDLDRFEWVFMDISSPPFESLAGYVHGRGIPLMKAYREESPPGAFLDMLGGYEALGRSGAREIGYRKDVLVWRDVRSLRAGLQSRLDRFRWGMKPIEAERAGDYFLDATRRSTPVFLSYSGDDEEQVRPFGDALRKRFGQVFDYRDGRSMRSGKPWGPQLEERLEEAGLGIIMLSPSYLDKTACVREAELMSNHQFQGTQAVMVIKLANAADGTTIKAPGHLSGDQHLRAWEYDNAEVLIEKLVQDYDSLRRDSR